MGKGKKRKNPGVGVDFRKVKHKVGKKLPKAQNETSTDFQARSINLPNQSIKQDKAGAAVSERNLTLKELVAQLAHHNTTTRRDALTGLQQLVTSHPAEARRHTALLLEALAPRLSDGEASVRTTLLTTLRCAVLPALGPATLSPFMPLLLAHVSAALTNLSADVRLDALAVLEAVTEAAPQLMGQQLGVGLAHYTGLLSRANRGKSVKSQALSGLLKVVASLDKFLQAALAAAATSSTGSIANSPAAAPAGAGDAAGMVSASSSAETAVLLLQQRAAPAPLAASQVPSAAVLLQLYCPGLAVDSSTHAATSSSKTKQQKQKQQQQWGDGDAAAATASSVPLQQQVLALLEVMFDVWSEAAPGSLSAAPEAESAQVLVHILNSTHLIMTHFSPNSSSSRTLLEADTPLASLSSRGPVCHGFNTRRDQTAWLQKAGGIVLPKLLKAFPVSPPATHSLGVALADLLQRFNLLGMQLCAGFMAAGLDWPQQQQQQQQQHVLLQQQQQALMDGGLGYTAEPALPFLQQEWHARVLEFMAGVLAAGNCLPTIQQAAAPAGLSANRGGTPTSSKGKGKQQQQQQSDQAAAAAAVVPANSSLSSSSMMVTVLHSLQQLLPQMRGPPRQHILAAVGQLAAAAASGVPRSSPEGPEGPAVLQHLSPAAAAAAGSNAVRSACLRLQLQLMLQHLWQGESVASEGADIAAWLAAAPRLLYELGSNKPKISQLLLQLLFEAARLCVPGSAVEQQLHALQPHLAALLGTALPPPPAPKHAGQQQQQQQQKGGPDSAAAAAAGQAVRVLVGPLADLPPACQHLAFDTLSHLPQVTPALLKAVALSCRVTSYSDASVQRLVDGVLSGAASSMQPDVYISFVATLMDPGALGGYIDRGSKQQVQAGFARHQQCVDAACRWLHCYGPLPELLQLLAAPLLQQWQAVQQLWLQQGQGQVAGAAQQQQQQQVHKHVCGATYSLVALAALGAGCWLPSSSSSSSAGPAAGDAAEVGVPLGLLSVLPQVLAVHCLCRAGASADAVASQAAVEQCLQQLVLPMVYGLPGSTLLLPFMQQIVQQGLSQQQQQGVRVVVHVLRVLLHQQGLKLVWLQHGSEVQQLLQQVQATAQQLQDQSGEGGAVAEVEQLQTALAMLCKILV